MPKETSEDFTMNYSDVDIKSLQQEFKNPEEAVQKLEELQENLENINPELVSFDVDELLTRLEEDKRNAEKYLRKLALKDACQGVIKWEKSEMYSEGAVARKLYGMVKNGTWDEKEKLVRRVRSHLPEGVDETQYTGEEIFEEIERQLPKMDSQTDLQENR